MKLHLGCGGQHKEGYINIDIKARKSVDLVCDAMDLPYEENSIDLIEGYHMFEHLSDGEQALKHWHKLLKPFGTIIMEIPNLKAVLDEYAKRDNYKFCDLMVQVYGRNLFKGDTHQYGYSRKTIKGLFIKCGFDVIYMGEGTDEPQHTNRLSIRIEAIKK